MDIEKIKDLIYRSGKKRQDIVLQSGVSKATLDNVLKGMDPKVSTIESIARALDVSTAVFFGASVDGEAASLYSEIKMLNKEIAHLKAEMALKDELLESKNTIISLLNKKVEE